MQRERRSSRRLPCGIVAISVIYETASAGQVRRSSAGSKVGNRPDGAGVLVGRNRLATRYRSQPSKRVGALHSTSRHTLCLPASRGSSIHASWLFPLSRKWISAGASAPSTVALVSTFLVL